LVVGDIQKLKAGESTLSLITNAQGGIMDDTVINREGNQLYVVSNAGCADKDWKHFNLHVKLAQSKGMDVHMSSLSDHFSLLALQGPKAAQVVETLLGSSLANLKFMTSTPLTIKGVSVYVSRCGYTGEDGFEIRVSHKDAPKLANLLLNDPHVKWAGLGARDILRLEAGLCLYGQDIDETISPVEASLLWTIGQRRRTEGGFLGADLILPQIKGPVTKRRVGIISEGPPARGNLMERLIML
jgi:aminomethyltransferase